MTSTVQYSGIDPLTQKARTLYVDGGVIQAEEPCVDTNLPLMLPGLIDLQINGYNGHDLNSGSVDASEVEALSDSLCQVGIAAYLPTLITASEQDLCQRLSAINQAQQSLPRSRRMIAGIHVEGPSISRKDGPRGAHPLEHVRPPTINEFDRWQEAANGLIRMITIAPEVEGAIAYIRQIAERGVCVALGHCDATEDDIQRAVDAGARMSTHLGNGIASTIPRHPNAIWAQLAEDRLSASLILDGFHLPCSTARSMIRAKGIERVILISDSVKFAGMAPGQYSSTIGGNVDVSKDGRVSIAGTPYLAGSGKSLLDVVVGFSKFVGLPISHAITMATHNPAKFLRRSSILAPGEPADFILLDLDDENGSARVQDIIFDGISVLS